MSGKKIICLFDVDGTLTAPRKVIVPEMQSFLLNEVKSRCTVGLVGGSDELKIAEQMGGQAEIDKYDFIFSENGLVAKKCGKEIARTSIVNHVGEEKVQKFINFALKTMSEITLPAKRGTFIEFRSGLINVCPVGRSCTQAERDQFAEYDAKYKIREKLVAAFKKEFPNSGLTYAIVVRTFKGLCFLHHQDRSNGEGNMPFESVLDSNERGQISVDVFPEGWDKTYSLRFVEGFDEIHFFGDKVQPGGNDYEIFVDPRTIGHSVTSPDDTKKQLKELFKID